MKKNYLFILLLMCVWSYGSFAQDYGFVHSNGTYVPLTGGTSVNGTTVWDDDEWTVPIGFTFNYYGQSFTDVTISDSYVYFGASEDLTIHVLYGDLQDRGDVTSGSPITTKLEGAAGNRILKIEWKNAGFYDGSSEDSANFQLWLHEGIDDVTMVYGISSVANVNDAFLGTGPSVGLIDLNNDGYHTLEGDPADPTFRTSFSLNTLVGMPSEGKIYYFGDVGIGIEGYAKTGNFLSLYPNPFRDALFLTSASSKVAGAQIQLFDLTGKKVMDINPAALSQGKMKVDLSALNSGVYFLQVVSGDKIETHRVVKQ